MSNSSHYIEELVTGVGAAAGGVILASLAGPLGGIIGAGVGGSAALVVIRNLDSLTDLHKEILTRRIVKRMICGKLQADFNDSFLSNTTTATLALKDAKRIIDLAKVKIDGPDKRFECKEPLLVQEGILPEPIIRKHLKALRNYRSRIRVSCTAVCAATVSVLKSLQEKYGDDEKYGNDALRLDIDFDPCNGRDQVSKIVKDDSFDFLVVPNDPFFFAAYMKTNRYKLLLPCHGADQYLFMRKGARYVRTTQLHVLVESSAELHAQYHPLIPRGTGAKRTAIIEAEEIPSLVENMAGGDCILAWAPLSSFLRRNPAYEIVEGSRHHIYYCLRCHERWTKYRAHCARTAFQALFTDEWKLCNASRRRAYRLLADDQQYLTRFAIGLGIKIALH